MTKINLNIIVLVIVAAIVAAAIVLKLKTFKKNPWTCEESPSGKTTKSLYLTSPSAKSYLLEQILDIAASTYYTPLPSLSGGWTYLTASPLFSPLKEAFAVVVCQNLQTSEYAVGIRGSVIVTTEAGLIDWFNDLDVGKIVPAPLGIPGRVSKGASNGTTAVKDAVIDFALYIPRGAKRVYVTGHSLGGSLVPLISFMVDQQCAPLEVVPVSFAAPSVGDATFAAAFDAKFKTTSIRVWNNLDIVPHAWSNLGDPPAYLKNVSSPFFNFLFSTLKNLANTKTCFTQVSGSLILDGSGILASSGLTSVVEKIGLMHSHTTYSKLLQN